MKRLILTLLASAAFCAPAYAADPPPAPTLTWSSYTGAGTVRTEAGDVKPMLSARFTVNVALPLGLHVVGRAEAARQQDGGAVEITDPRTFDVLELYGGVYRDILPGIGIAAAYGFAVPFEGGDARVLERYPQTLFAGARYGTAGGISVYAGVGRHDAAGPGLKGIVTAQVPTGGRSAVATEIVYPHGYVRTLVLLRIH